MTDITATSDLARSTPLVASAFYLNFISQYGTTVVTSLAIIYGVMQIILRFKEHRMRSREYVYVGN